MVKKKNFYQISYIALLILLCFTLIMILCFADYMENDNFQISTRFLVFLIIILVGLINNVFPTESLKSNETPNETESSQLNPKDEKEN
jgi:hypothetical protein